MDRWLLLLYKVPHEPSAGRVSVWRKLKRLGAVLLHDSVWVLPAAPWTREQFQWLTAEIAELEGEAMVWESQLLMGQNEALVKRFRVQVDEIYEDLLTGLHRENADLAVLSRRYQQARAIDYFHSKLGERVREALLAAKGGEAP